MSELRIHQFDSFTLEDGTTLQSVEVAYQTWGSLNASGDNAVIVFHTLSGDSNIETWWGALLGSGRALCTESYFLICANLLGSCYGTTGPTSINPDTGAAYGSSFPVPTIRDNVRLQQRLLEELGVRRVQMAIGGSLGGMMALEWALVDARLQSVVVVAASGRHSAWCIGWSEAQRQAIYADPKWRGGNYDVDDPPRSGLASARMMAMLSYRTPGSFRERFGRNLVTAQEQTSCNRRNGKRPEGRSSVAAFSVETYLRHQGTKLVNRFDANSYVRLTQTTNSHDVGRNRGSYERVLQSISQPALVVGIDSDMLFPLEEQQELARLLPNATMSVLHSSNGHDAFLLEADELNRRVVDWQRATFGLQTGTRFTLQNTRSISSQPLRPLGR